MANQVKAIALILQELLGDQFIVDHPRHPGAVAYQLFASSAWQKRSTREQVDTYQDHMFAALSLSELFSQKQDLSLGDLTSFAGAEYANQMRARARDSSDFPSVLSEIWIANKMTAAGLRLQPIMRPLGKQADFTAENAGGIFQIECKVAVADSTPRSIKEKVQKANRQFRAHTQATAGLLVVHVLGSPQQLESSDGPPPPAVQGIIDLLERLLKGGMYRAVSAVMLLWDSSRVEPGPKVSILVRVRSSKLIGHPTADIPLNSGRFDKTFGATSFMVIKRVLPTLTVAQGGYSSKGRILIV